MAPKAGDSVRVVDRETTADDAKSGLYYSYFGGLEGSIDRVYDDGTVCVDIDLASLTEEMRKRHLAVQEGERKRWLDGLSDEVRNRLTAEQKQLKMNYRILVSAKDVEVTKGGKPSGTRAKSEAQPAGTEPAERKGAPRAPTPAASSSSQPAEPPDIEESSPRRLSEADLEAAEEAFLRSRQSGA